MCQIQCLQVNGISMGVVQYGNKSREEACPLPHATLVLLHGFTGSSLGWGSIIANLAGSGLPIVALDMLGHGQSDAPTDVERYSIEHC